MPTKVKELEANPLKRNGNKANCIICTPREDRVPHWKVWRWSLENPGVDPFKPGTKV